MRSLSFHLTCPPRSSAGSLTVRLLFSFLALSPLSAVAASPDPVLPPLRATALPDNVFGPGPVIGGEGGGKQGHTFTLRHILHHGADLYPYQLRRLDIRPDTLVATEDEPQLRPPPKLFASSRSRSITRLVDRSKDTMESYLWSHRTHSPTTFGTDAWTTERIPQPNVT
jgi:lipase ATG15